MRHHLLVSLVTGHTPRTIENWVGGLPCSSHALINYAQKVQDQQENRKDDKGEK